MKNRPSQVLGLLFLSICFSGACSLFSTRSPEDPLTDAGTFSQPDTPEQVVDNLISAIAELNTLNYRRSLNENLIFHPTASAEARETVFANWGRAQEEQYFSAASAAAIMNTGHGLVLNDRSFSIRSDTEFIFDATYVLTINHRQPAAPTEAQGRLQWIIVQGSGGLWDLMEWTDQELGSVQAWSDLKAEFVK
ncbi:MAG: hypothetical protein HKN13_07815 [Rhodothermales bacterium]|nr:hypothetical protein [Rhodothermales bacterium]